jgi:glycine cleavage system aminomethyltransferase T
LLLSDPAPMLYHNEPILQHGKRVGLITSAMYGHTLGGAVGLGYVADADGVTDELIAAGDFAVLVGDHPVPAQASLRPLYDPRGTRIRI